MRLGIGAGGEEAERIVDQLLRHQPAFGRALGGDGDVGLAPRQREGARHRHELDLQVAMLRGQRAEPRREEGDAETVGRADAHRARHLLAFAGDLGAGGDHVGFHALGDGEEALAGRRQLAAGGEPAKELCAERLLQRGDPARDGGVVEFEPPRRAEDLARRARRRGRCGRHPSSWLSLRPTRLRANHGCKSRSQLAVHQFSAQRLRFRSRCQARVKAGQWRHIEESPGSET